VTCTILTATRGASREIPDSLERVTARLTADQTRERL
jgi:hypothetical protein